MFGQITVWTAKVTGLTMSDDLNMPASRFIEQDIKQLDESSWPKSCGVEVLCVSEVKVAVEELHMLLVVLCKLIDVTRGPAMQQIDCAFPASLKGSFGQYQRDSA